MIRQYNEVVDQIIVIEQREFKLHKNLMNKNQIESPENGLTSNNFIRPEIDISDYSQPKSTIKLKANEQVRDIPRERVESQAIASFNDTTNRNGYSRKKIDYNDDHIIVNNFNESSDNDNISDSEVSNKEKHHDDIEKRLDTHKNSYQSPIMLKTVRSKENFDEINQSHG